MELENIILSEVTEIQKRHAWYVLTNKWIQKRKKEKKKERKDPYRMQKTQSTEFKRLIKLKCPREDDSVLLG